MITTFSLGSKLNFGKYKNRYLRDVIDLDIIYINWCLINVPFFLISYEAESYIENLKGESKCIGLVIEAKIAIDQKLDAQGSIDDILS